MEPTATDWVADCVAILEASVNLGAQIYPVIWGFLIVKKIMRF